MLIEEAFAEVMTVAPLSPVPVPQQGLDALIRLYGYGFLRLALLWPGVWLRVMQFIPDFYLGTTWNESECTYISC